jgi:hypothetical protein
MAQETGYLKKTRNISADRTKIHANVGRHSAVSRRYETYQAARGGRTDVLGSSLPAGIRVR